MNFSKIRSVVFSGLLLLSLGSSCPVWSMSLVTAPEETVSKPKKIVLFDLGGVLVETSHTSMGGEIGYGDCVWYALWGFRNPSNLKNIGFSVLDTITKPQVAESGSALAMADGLVMPGLMCEWMRGTVTGQEIIDLVHSTIDGGTCDTLFSSSTEKRLVKKVVGAIFNPATLAKHTHPIKKGIELLEACAQREDLTLMILSNYGADAFEELYNKTESQKVFKYFAPEKMVISGFIGTMKPCRSIYSYLIKEYHLDPAECVIIDDQEENILAAQAAGFETVWIKKNNFSAARKKLVELGVLEK